MNVSSLNAVANAYRNEIEIHSQILEHFLAAANATPLLKEHRDFVEANQHGFGDREFHWMWKLIVDSMPPSWSFLEIGVYKGQVLSLVQLLSQHMGKICKATGITPLDNSGDTVSNYALKTGEDYYSLIRLIHERFEVQSWPQTKLIRGFSNDSDVIRMARSNAYYDAIYIDGCHDYEVVVSDINYYAPRVRPGGWLICDDASSLLNMPGHRYVGWEPVSRAVKDVLEPRSDFQHLFAVGHNRVWRRTQ